MNKFILLIITNAVALVTSALKFIPLLTVDLYNAAIDEACTQLQASKAQFTAQETLPTPTIIEGMLGNGLGIIQASLDSKGDTKYDGILEVGETIVTELEGGNFNLVTAIENYTAARKAEKQAAAE